VAAAGVAFVDDAVGELVADATDGREADPDGVIEPRSVPLFG